MSFNESIPLSKELCEFVGAYIGDGCSSRFGKDLTHYLIQFSGDFNKDLDYYIDTINPIAEKLFNLTPKIKKINNTLRVNFYSKQLLFFLNKRFNMPIGKKSHIVKIPEEILRSNQEHLFSTVRGIFDTDGCVFIDKRKIYIKPYPRITLQIVSKPLYLQLKNILKPYFSLYCRENDKRHNYYIEVYGHIQLDKWMNLIGFSNKRHLLRLPNAPVA